MMLHLPPSALSIARTPLTNRNISHSSFCYPTRFMFESPLAWFVVVCYRRGLRCNFPPHLRHVIPLRFRYRSSVLSEWNSPLVLLFFQATPASARHVAAISRDKEPYCFEWKQARERYNRNSLDSTSCAYSVGKRRRRKGS